MSSNRLIVFYCLAAIITIVPCSASSNTENVVTVNTEDPLLFEYDIDSVERLEEDSYVTKNIESLQTTGSGLKNGKLVFIGIIHVYINIFNQAQINHLLMKEQQELQVLTKGPLGKDPIMTSMLSNAMSQESCLTVVVQL